MARGRKKRRKLMMARGSLAVTAKWEGTRGSYLTNIPPVDESRIEHFLTHSQVVVKTPMTKAKPANLVGKTDILQLAALMKRCKVYLTPDSAPLHVAAAVNTPIITFFGPTDATRHVPPAKTMVILDKKLACAPCYSPRCRILTHACMKDISPEEVLRNINELMGVKV